MNSGRERVERRLIDAAIRARAEGEEQRTRAIVIYPMNALANSQPEELNKFLDQSGLPENLRPTFAGYTGQENTEERERIREAKPDILLTNFMMIELLMTRQSKLDQTVIENAQELDFIVLDELHTFRDRQGADVAMLVRRLRDRLCRERPPLCIGTSATMSSQEDDTEHAVAVAKVASRLFGTDISPDAVIDETLERATDPNLNRNHSSYSRPRMRRTRSWLPPNEMAEPVRNFLVTSHAAFEMARRGIDEGVVSRVLAAPERRHAVRPGRDVLQSRITFAGKTYILRVFVDIDRDPAEVVRVYRTSRIAKYWRV